jgi:hypothetical protein
MEKDVVVFNYQATKLYLNTTNLKIILCVFIASFIISCTNQPLSESRIDRVLSASTQSEAYIELSRLKPSSFTNEDIEKLMTYLDKGVDANKFGKLLVLGPVNTTSL